MADGSSEGIARARLRTRVGHWLEYSDHSTMAGGALPEGEVYVCVRRCLDTRTAEQEFEVARWPRLLSRPQSPHNSGSRTVFPGAGSS